MNSKTVTAASKRVFYISGSGNLSLLGSGTVNGRGYSVEETVDNGGTVNVQSGAVLNIDGPTVGRTDESGRSAKSGGVIYVYGGEVNLYSGNIVGSYSQSGGAIGASGAAVINLYGGTVTGGTTTSSSGGAIYLYKADTTLNIDGAEVIGGNSATYGGAIHAHSSTKLFIRSGSVTGGTAEDSGGCIYFRGATFQMSGGTVTGGNTKNAAGSIYIYKTSAMEMSGGTVKNGTAKNITDGVCIPTGATISLSGNASIEELRFDSYANKAVTVTGECTGTVVFRGAKGEANDGVVIGNAVNANLKKAKYTIYNTDYYVIHKGDDLVISSVGYIEPVTIERRYCNVCQKEAEWIALTANDCTDDSYIYTGHYYLAFEGDSCQLKTKSIVGYDRVCLDLRGKSLDAPLRAFYISKGTLNIMDTVGGGEICGRGTANTGTVNGGTIVVLAPSTLNLYGGKLTYQMADDGRASIYYGGVVYVRGQMNIYGGEVSGGAAKCGANIYGATGTEDGVTYVSHIGLYGGTVGGHVAVPNESTRGTGVFARGYVTLSGNPYVSELYPLPSDSEVTVQNAVTFKDTFTGTVQLRYATYKHRDIGNSVNADLRNANISIYDYPNHRVLAWNGELLRVTDNTEAYLFLEDGTANVYADFFDALAACGQNDKLVLFKDVAEDITISNTVTLDLNGYTISGNISGSGTLICMDHATDDFDVQDGAYGKLTGKITCNVEGAGVTSDWSDDNYLMITEGSEVSFHRVQLQIDSVTLRPNCAGIYYQGSFFGDDMVKQRIASFGIILNAKEAPSGQNMDTTSRYTAFDKEQFNAGSTSCLLKNIMKTDIDDSENLVRSDTPIYSNAYVLLTNGDILYGDVVSINLKSMAALINANWQSLTLTQKEAFLSMFHSYRTVMSDESWSVTSAVSIANAIDTFNTTDYSLYQCPDALDVVEKAKKDNKIYYYFMATEGLLISETQSDPEKWGDACLVVFPNGQTMLIDCGPTAFAPLLTRNLQRMGITRLDYILITHPHSDHQYGIFHDAALFGTDFMELFEIGKVFWRGGYDIEVNSCRLVYNVCTELGIPIEVISKGDVLQIGDVRMECLWPLTGDGDNLISVGTEINNTSIVVRFDYGEHSSIFAADLYVKGEKNLIESVDPHLLDADLLKVPHHGFDTSSSIDFIQAISPEIAVATNRIVIPKKVIDRYIGAGVTLLDDLTKGYIQVTADAFGNMEYTTSRSDVNDENAPESTPDTDEGND